MIYEVTVTNHDGINGVLTSTSGETFETSHPTSSDKGTNPEELLAAAWATCLNATIQALLSARGHKNLRSRVRVSVSLHQETIGYHFKLDAVASIEGLSIEEASPIVHSADKRCPVSKIFSGYNHLKISIENYADSSY